MEKRLYRSITDQKLGGVCAGIAKYFGIDPSIIRLVWIFAFFCLGIGALAYLLAWFIIPEEKPF